MAVTSRDLHLQESGCPLLYKVDFFSYTLKYLQVSMAGWKIPTLDGMVSL